MACPSGYVYPPVGNVGAVDRKLHMDRSFVVPITTKAR